MSEKDCWKNNDIIIGAKVYCLVWACYGRRFIKVADLKCIRTEFIPLQFLVFWAETPKGTKKVNYLYRNVSQHDE